MVAWQQQTDEILAQGLAFFIAPEQVVERGAELVDRLGRWRIVGLRAVGMVHASSAQARSHFNSVALPQQGMADSMPHLTNQR